jgi:serine/threonine protein phosphatase PrpC
MSSGGSGINKLESALRKAVKEAFLEIDSDFSQLPGTVQRRREAGSGSQHHHHHGSCDNYNSVNGEDDGIDSAGTTATVALVIHGFDDEKTSKGDLGNHSTNNNNNNINSGDNPPLLVVGNVGDSRAVLCCKGTTENWQGMTSGEVPGEPVPLSIDHTPALPDERARIESVTGGFVEHHGVLRVQGRLAVSRSIGDLPLKRYLSAEPDVVVRELTSEDIFVVLGSDGLWDVMSNEEAVQLVWEVMVAHDKSKCEYHNHGDEEDGGYSIFQEAAMALTHEAFIRGSNDNIGVCVIDVRINR